MFRSAQHDTSEEVGRGRSSTVTTERSQLVMKAAPSQAKSTRFFFRDCAIRMTGFTLAWFCGLWAYLADIEK